MNQTVWSEVDNYFCDALVSSDPALDAALAASAEAGLPAHQVAPNQGKLLQLLAQLQGAKRILEIGTLGGYSTIWLARAVGENGRVVTLEANPAHAAIASANIAHAGLADRIELRVGKAAETLPLLVEAGVAPFDLIFIDADKPNNPRYLAWALQLSRPGTLIIGDNVVRNGAVVDPQSDDPNVIGVRTFVDMMSTHPRLQATAIQTVGSKGYDGFTLALVTA